MLEKFRWCRIDCAKLMNVAEEIGFQSSYIVCIGAELHSGYGSTQGMYVKIGYVPDGSGVRYQDKDHIWIAVMMMIWFCISQRGNVSRETFCG